MTDFLDSPSYSKAPITEAVIDFRVSSNVKDVSQKKLVRKLEKEYPRSDALQQVAVQVDTTGGSVRIDEQQAGHRLTSEDQLNVVMIQPNGITVSRLAPYLGWQEFEDHAKKVWDKWRDTIAYTQVNRIGVRFINRIDVPVTVDSTQSNKQSGVNLNKYLLFLASDPTENNNPMESFLVQTVRKGKLPHWITSITSTVVNPPPLINHTSLLLDIDVFRTNEIPTRVEQLWETVAEARKIKNDIFERCITPATRELIR